MAERFRIIEVYELVDLNVCDVAFLRDGEVIHVEEFVNNYSDMGVRIVVDARGRRIQEDGTLVPPDVEGGYPPEDPDNPYQRETFSVDVKQLILDDIRRYAERHKFEFAERRFDSRDPQLVQRKEVSPKPLRDELRDTTHERDSSR